MACLIKNEAVDEAERAEIRELLESAERQGGEKK
jgi:hypothetical protein